MKDTSVQWCDECMTAHAPGKCEAESATEELATLTEAVDEARRLLERTLLTLGEPRLEQGLVRDVEIWLEEYR
jgi:hypothetical protein